MSWTVHQSESALDLSGGMTVTLPGATTNGRFLVVLYGAVLGGRSQSLGGAWTDILNQACDAGEAGGWAYAAWRPITANENSVTLVGTSTTANQYAALFEVSCTSAMMEASDFVVNNLSGTGTTIAMGPVDAVLGDLVMALGLFHDDDGSSFSWSNSFGSGPAYRETSSGTPDLGAQAAYRIVPSAASYSTTATVNGPPGADERHGFMVVLHELAIVIQRDAGIGNAVDAVAGVIGSTAAVAGIDTSINAVAGNDVSFALPAGVVE